MKRLENKFLANIFPQNNGQKVQNESIKICEIAELFRFLQSPQNDQTEKFSILSTLGEIINSFRMFAEFFSIIDSKSIYIHLINLYLEKTTTQPLKKEILSLISELILHLQTDKKIFDYVYQKLSTYYRKEAKLTSEILNDFLILLMHLYGNTEFVQSPKNYIAAVGNCSIDLETDKGKEIIFGTSMTFILNFRIHSLKQGNELEHIDGVDQTSDIIKLYYDDSKEFSISLNYPIFCVIKSFRNSFIKQFPNDEWINFIITLQPKDDGLYVFLLVNGENNPNKHVIKGTYLNQGSRIKSIKFFENFVGEIGSIVGLNQKENEIPTSFFPMQKTGGLERMGTMNPLNSQRTITSREKLKVEFGMTKKELLKKFRSFKEGYWKKKEIDKLLDEFSKEAAIINGDPFKKLKDDIIFLFSPIYSSGDFLEDMCERYLAKLNGLIKIHTYFCFQEKIFLIGGVEALIPISEMMFLQQECLTEDILNNFLSIITTILKSRKKNMKNALSVKLFEKLSLFIERYPAKIFTEKILEAFFCVGRTNYSEEDNSLSSIFFEEILFNEKILSKYSKNLQIKFWSQIELFCQSDNTQIGVFLNMRKVCLILLSYDKKKYYQMCCETHYNQLKPEYMGIKAIMNPPMTVRLSDIEGIMKSTLDYQKVENAFSLFKLLTLDISPCLAKFIITAFKSVLQNPNNPERKERKKWKNEFLNHFFNGKNDVVLANTLRHSLLDVRLEIIDLLYEIKKIPPSENYLLLMKESFRKLEKMLKTALLPGDMFYELKSVGNKNINEISELALHCVNKIKQTPTKSPCDKYNNSDIVFKENEYQNYITQVFQKLILWSLDFNIDDISKFNQINYDICILKHEYIFQILLQFCDYVDDLKLTKDLFDIVEKITIQGENCKQILDCKPIYSWLLSTTFKNFKNSDEYAYNIASKGKTIVIDILVKSILDPIESQKVFKINQIEIIMIWGDSVISNENKENLFEFVNYIIIEALKRIITIIGPEIKEENGKIEITNITHCFSYQLMVSILFQYYILFKEEVNYQSFKSEEKEICLPKSFVIGMKLKRMVNDKTLENNWVDYPLFNDLFRRISFIWSSKNTFKDHLKTLKSNKNKIIKYEYVLQNIILNKDKKNLYFSDLNYLCLGEFDSGIIPLIKLIPITMASIIQIIMNDLQNQTELHYWLKQFRNFTRFIIIASSNITPINQQDIYNKFEASCLREIGFALCFLKSIYNTISLEKEYLELIFKDIITLLCIIMKSTFEYIEVHSKKMFKSIFRKARNDLSQCAVFLLFQQYVVDKKGIPIFSYQFLKKNNLNQYDRLISIMLSNDNEYQEGLYCNQKLKEEIDKNFLLINELYNNMKGRCDIIEELKNQIDDSYTKEINDLVPEFESELGKYSSNSFNCQKEKKNEYKRIKKHLFSWRGMWSDRNLFYNNVDKLKFRLLNHYTKSFLRPVLVPILDYEYYLPNFTSFSIDNLFRDTERVFSLNLDIEKELKSVQSIEEVKEKAKNEKVSENYNRKIYRKSNPELSYAYSKFIDKIELGKEEDLITMMQNNIDNKNSLESEKKKRFYLCCFVKTSHHIKGMFEVLNDRIVFKVFYNQKAGTSLKGTDIGFTQKNEDYDHDRKTCFGSYFVWHHKDLDLNEFVLKFSDIKFFFRKRYYYKDSAIEFFSTKNKSYYFNFKVEKEREDAIGEILDNIKKKEKIINNLRETKDNFENVVGYSLSTDPKKKVKKVKLSKKIKSWVNWEISNIEILMWLNFFSNRSYLDISQYPVMPWVLNDYSNKLTYSYRNLSLPMGMLEDSENSKLRKETFIDLYNSLKNDPENEMVPFIYGTHYSNPVYVCNYLTRLFPFSHIMIELSGNKFDNPDRLFLSIETSYLNSTTQKTDVREIIPEFFFLPEMFININNLNLGVKENKELVNDVLIPWSSNPYDFVMTLRRELEGGEVSAQINKWIDLIFGIKNRGKEAELAYNLFTRWSYEDEIDISKYPDKACLFRMVEFGITPEQVIGKDCPMKRDKEILSERNDLSQCDYVVFDSEVKFDNKGDMNSIIKIQMLENDKIAILFNNGIYMQIKVSYSSLEKIYSSQISKSPIKIKPIQQSLLKMKKFYAMKTQKTNHVAIYNKGKSIAMGGFFDGFIILIHFEPNYEQSILKCKLLDNSPISAIEITKDELFAICGNERGNIIIYSINEKEWTLYKRIFNDFAAINHIFSSDELNLWASCSDDGYINIYTLPLSKNVRSIQLPEGEVGNYIFLSSSPLPCIVIIQNNDESGMLFVYTLNGHLHVKQQVTEGNVTSPILVRDFFFNEYIAYISKDSVYLRNLPSLLNCAVIAINGSGITKLCLSENMKYLYGISEDGKKVKIIKDQKVEDEMNQNFILRESLIKKSI